MKLWTSAFATAIVISSCAVAAAQTPNPPPQTPPQGGAAPSQAPPAQRGRREWVTERITITAIPMRRLFVLKGQTMRQPAFNSYGPGGALGIKLTDWVGVEGELAWTVGKTQDLHFEGRDLGSFTTPGLFGYSGNVIVNLIQGDRIVVPYVTVGVGGVHASAREELGMTSSENFLAHDAGAGAKVMWGPIGVRGDYRFFTMRTESDDRSFLGGETRHGHRIYCGLVIAPGRHRVGS
jgi:hypothetical protein